MIYALHFAARRRRLFIVCAIFYHAFRRCASNYRDLMSFAFRSRQKDCPPTPSHADGACPPCRLPHARRLRRAAAAMRFLRAVYSVRAVSFRRGVRTT